LDCTGLDIKELADGVAVKVRVQPRSSRNTVAGIYDNSLKVCLTSPPVEGEANQACINFFANLFQVAKNKVCITAGHKTRNKIIKISGIDKRRFIFTLQNFI